MLTEISLPDNNRNLSEINIYDSDKQEERSPNSKENIQFEGGREGGHREITGQGTLSSFKSGNFGTDKQEIELPNLKSLRLPESEIIKIQNG